jgi:GTP-binding protein
MIIHTADFLISNTNPDLSPEPKYPEYAFIGRSNVGKSSLINMLCQRKGLAKTSGRPGKTQLINHFTINEKTNPWYLVDLPGYGFAKTSKKMQLKWNEFTRKYILHRVNLMYLFVLIDARLEPQKIDLEFMEWCGAKQIPFVMVFTKADKLSSSQLGKNQRHYKKEMLKSWAELPPYVVTSAETGLGRDEVLRIISDTNPMFEEIQKKDIS